MPTLCATFATAAAAAAAARRLRAGCDADVRVHCPPPGHAGAADPQLAAGTLPEHEAEAEAAPVMAFAAVLHDVEGECLLSATMRPEALPKARSLLAAAGAAEVWDL